MVNGNDAKEIPAAVAAATSGVRYCSIPLSTPNTITFALTLRQCYASPPPIGRERQAGCQALLVVSRGQHCLFASCYRLSRSTRSSSLLSIQQPRHLSPAPLHCTSHSWRRISSQLDLLVIHHHHHHQLCLVVLRVRAIGYLNEERIYSCLDRRLERCARK